jgi:hypothetical protein
LKYLSLFLFSSILLAQAPQRIIYVNTDPSGSCNDSSALQWNPSSGNFSGCKSGTWGVIASGGGGGGCTSLAGDVTGPCGSNTAVKIENGAIPASEFCIGTNSSSQIVAPSSFTSSLPGCVPASGGGTTNFLRADGNWAAPPGGGGGSPGGTTNSIQYYATSSTFGGITAPANGTPSFNVWNGSNTYVTEPWASIVGPSGYLSVPSPSCTGSFLCLDVVTALGTGLAAQNQPVQFQSTFEIPAVLTAADQIVGSAANTNGTTVGLGLSNCTTGGLQYSTSTHAFSCGSFSFSSLSGQATNAQLATQTANTILGALTATTPSGLAMPSCSTSASALLWTSGTGMSCNTSIAAATVTNLTLSAALTTTGASTPTIAFPASGTPTYTFPSGSTTIPFGSVYTLGDANATISPNTATALIGTALTTARTYTLPLSSGYAGQVLTISDPQRNASFHVITFATQGTDTINGCSQSVSNAGLVTESTYQTLRTFYSNGSGNWISAGLNSSACSGNVTALSDYVYTNAIQGVPSGNGILLSIGGVPSNGFYWLTASPNTIGMETQVNLAWGTTSNPLTNALDTSLSRLSAGVLCVGTGPQGVCNGAGNSASWTTYNPTASTGVTTAIIQDGAAQSTTAQIQGKVNGGTLGWSITGNGKELLNNSLIITPILTASLPACASSTGPATRAAVSDATAPAIGVALTGGGAVFATVHCSLTTGTYLVDGL